jgi:hypothetical protein
MSAGRLLSIIASVVMLGAVLGGWYVLGTPVHQRELRLDNQRVLALSLIATGIHQYWTQHDALPGDLDATDIQARWRSDPVTGKPYVYNRQDKETYSLCAEFDTSSDGLEKDFGEAMPRTYVPTGATWKHPTGMHCFRFQADGAATPSA